MLKVVCFTPTLHADNHQALGGSNTSEKLRQLKDESKDRNKGHKNESKTRKTRFENTRRVNIKNISAWVLLDETAPTRCSNSEARSSVLM